MAVATKKTIYEKKNGIAYLTINNPEKANVMDDQVIEVMGEEYKDFWDDRDMRCMIITGIGDRHFSAGHHIQPPPPGMTYEDVRQDRIDQFIWPPAMSVNGRRPSVDPRSGHDFPQIWKPVIAAVNGWAAGAGLYTLLTTTDIRIGCQEHARFQYILLNQGWLGSGPGAARLPRQINHVDSMRMLLMDEPIDAQEALRIHLINEAVPHGQLMSRAEEMATRIASLAPVAVRMMKEFLIRGRDLPLDAAWQMSHLMNHLTAQLTTDPEEGRNAFNEKRERNFTGGLRVPGNPDGV